MKRAIASSVLAAAFLAGGTSVIRAQPAPAPAASALPELPEIGRTRATTTACAFMRDVVVPAFAAAQRADARFGTARTGLPIYIQLKADYRSQRVPVKSDGINLESQYNRLNVDAAALLRETDTIRKLLDDPRLSASSNDPTVRAEREQLERVYAAQQARAAALSELMMRESMWLNTHMVGFEDPLAIAVMTLPRNLDAPPRPAPKFTAPPGMPLLNGFDAADRARVNEWSTAMTSYVHTNEEQAAKAFLPLAQGCRARP
jgi:hypothetical protein